jgi:CobQ-like glutamine amidotransferase family enzyme
VPESASPLPTPPVLPTGHVLRVCALYPDLMNIYADRGNLLVLEHRCLWRGIGFEFSSSGLGERLSPDVHDLYYLGGGQDRDQRLCAEDLIEFKRDSLHTAAARDAVILGVCGGYQLLGHSYTLGEDEIPGVGLLDVRTVREDGPRLIGNVAIEVSLGNESADAEEAIRAVCPDDRILAGFENHGGRTYLGTDARALGRVVKGHGNDGRSGFEGARSGNTIGTYLHGPLLPKNAWFADWLIATALRIEGSELETLDDGLEKAAHLSARHAAGI